MPRRRLKKQIEHGSNEFATLIFLFSLVVIAMRVLASASQALFEFLVMFGRALDAFVRALSFPFLDRRAQKVYYYEIGERRTSPSAVTPRLAITVSASLAFVTLLSLIIATVWHPVYIILPPLFAAYAIIILLRDQYRQAKAA